MSPNRPFFSFLVLLLTLVAGFSNAQDRVALLIGNNDYPKDGNFHALKNCVNDVTLLEKTLKSVGFTVTKLTNATQAKMDEALLAFENSVPAGGTALVYFAGHGIEYQGQNYLMGSNAKLQARSRLGEEALKADTFAAAMVQAGAKTSFLLLDCCRELPASAEWAGRGQKKFGLADISIEGDIVIGMAASPGKQALEPRDAGGNSPYALALAKWIPKGLKHTDLFQSVRKEVHEMTDGQQRTWENGSFLNPFYFAVGKVAIAVPVDPIAAAVDPFAGKTAGESKRNHLGMPLRWCPPGEFWMGSPESEEGRDDDEIRHRVKLSKGFWLGQNEVTQGEWKAIMGRSLLEQTRLAIQSDEIIHWSDGKKETYRAHYGLEKNADPQSRVGDEHSEIPIYMVSWDDAMEFCKKLTARERAAGRLPVGWQYTLPTEAQWEYACRAGTDTAIYTGKLSIKGERNGPELDAIAWYGGNSSVEFTGRGVETAEWDEKQYPGGQAFTRKVGQKKANAWGVNDMIGNVWEWCSDGYGEYSGGFVTDPTGPATASNRVYRGGSWGDNARLCRAANRDRLTPTLRFSLLGFRVAVSSTPSR